MSNEDDSEIRSTARLLRHSVNRVLTNANTSFSVAATEVDKKTESIESNYQGNVSRFRAWRDTTDPAWVLGTMFLGTALVSRPAGTMPMIRNAVISTGLFSWLLYPQLTGEGVIMAKQMMKSSIKRRLE
mmetsp:Transcript_874/g.1122  ORF Transcript_874/g.1122 Transcript_874/m.1122 type:complete len:129 (-) Transcript_874:134-520(-)